MLEISEEEARGLWSLLAAIYHLGNASVKKSKPNAIYILCYTKGLIIILCVCACADTVGDYITVSFVRQTTCTLYMHVYIYVM